MGAALSTPMACRSHNVWRRLTIAALDRAPALMAHWAPAFRPQQTQRRLAQALARVYVQGDDGAEWPFPTAGAFGTILRRARPSAPGPDGLPYRAWPVAGPSSWHTLVTMTLYLTSGAKPPPSWGASRSVFLPKGTKADDPTASAARIRSAEETRPLALKNADAKATASTIAKPLGRVLRTSAPVTQQGFVEGRTGLHVVILDATARAIALEARFTRWPADPVAPRRYPSAPPPPSAPDDAPHHRPGRAGPHRDAAPAPDGAPDAHPLRPDAALATPPPASSARAPPQHADHSRSSRHRTTSQPLTTSSLASSPRLQGARSLPALKRTRSTGVGDRYGVLHPPPLQRHDEAAPRHPLSPGHPPAPSTSPARAPPRCAALPPHQPELGAQTAA